MTKPAATHPRNQRELNQVRRDIRFQYQQGAVAEGSLAALLARETELTAQPKLTVMDILNGLDDDRWLGFGYLGERNNAGATVERIADADAAILKVANDKGWTADELFHFLNSKDGRWFGDQCFGWTNPNYAEAMKLVRKQAAS